MDIWNSLKNIYNILNGIIISNEASNRCVFRDYRNHKFNYLLNRIRYLLHEESRVRQLPETVGYIQV